ncbi:Serine/threonine-protein kinase CHK1 [Termitomyces sp. T112]|nr:Serine/threonine-protein kinase CHK1 [Termitomyces sp. T112]
MSSKYPAVIGYMLVNQIGGSRFSTIFHAVNFSTHLIAACKLIKFTPATTPAACKSTEKEMRIHSVLKHPHILEFLNAVMVETKHAHLYVPGIYMLMELAGSGDLFDKIVPDVGIKDDVVHLYFNQLLSGMDYIRSQGMCHRNLKPENLLLDATDNLKISDFGLSAMYKLKESGRMRALTKHCGSLPYMAPELNLDEPYSAKPIDLWGIGTILYAMLTGNTPWDEPTTASPKFTRYISGSIVDEQLWSRFTTEALCILSGSADLGGSAALGESLLGGCDSPALVTEHSKTFQALVACVGSWGDVIQTDPGRSGEVGSWGNETVLVGFRQKAVWEICGSKGRVIVAWETKSKRGRRFVRVLLNQLKALGVPRGFPNFVMSSPSVPVVSPADLDEVVVYDSGGEEFERRRRGSVRDRSQSSVVVHFSIHGVSGTYVPLLHFPIFLFVLYHF